MTVSDATIARTAELCSDGAIHAYGVTVEAVTELNRRFDRRLRQECGVTLAWFEALLRLGRSGGSMTMSELAEQLSLTAGGITRMVDRMAAEGYVERRPCATDRRVSYATLTDAGVDMWERASRMHVADLIEHFTGTMTEEELAVVVRVMDRIRRGGDHS